LQPVEREVSKQLSSMGTGARAPAGRAALPITKAPAWAVARIAATWACGPAPPPPGLGCPEEQHLGPWTGSGPQKGGKPSEKSRRKDGCVGAERADAGVCTGDDGEQTALVNRRRFLRAKEGEGFRQQGTLDSWYQASEGEVGPRMGACGGGEAAPPAPRRPHSPPPRGYGPGVLRQAPEARGRPTPLRSRTPPAARQLTPRARRTRSCAPRPHAPTCPGPSHRPCSSGSRAARTPTGFQFRDEPPPPPPVRNSASQKPLWRPAARLPGRAGSSAPPAGGQPFPTGEYGTCRSAPGRKWPNRRCASGGDGRVRDFPDRVRQPPRPAAPPRGSPGSRHGPDARDCGKRARGAWAPREDRCVGRLGARDQHPTMTPRPSWNPKCRECSAPGNSGTGWLPEPLPLPWCRLPQSRSVKLKSATHPHPAPIFKKRPIAVLNEVT
jgi:hypothetical protein